MAAGHRWKRVTGRGRAKKFLAANLARRAGPLVRVAAGSTGTWEFYAAAVKKYPDKRISLRQRCRVTRRSDRSRG